MSEPTLALCIPACNAAAFLPRLLESAAGQSRPFDEIVVCDDASRDNTAQVARRYGEEVLAERSEPRLFLQARTGPCGRPPPTGYISMTPMSELLANFTRLARRWILRADSPDVVLFDYEYRDNEEPRVDCAIRLR